MSVFMSELQKEIKKLEDVLVGLREQRDRADDTNNNNHSAIIIGNQINEALGVLKTLKKLQERVAKSETASLQRETVDLSRVWNARNIMLRIARQYEDDRERHAKNEHTNLANYCGDMSRAHLEAVKILDEHVLALEPAKPKEVPS